MTKKLKRYAKYAFGLVMLAIFLMVAVNEGRSQDQDTRWIYRTIWKQRYACDWDGCYWRRWRETVRVRNHAYYLPEDRTRVYSYVRREDDDRHDGRYGRSVCKDRLKIVGDQHVSVDGAKGQADKAWSQTVRFYHGERFMDVANASGAAYTCSRSSVGETLGQTFNRCEIEARPCAPQRQESGR